MDHNQALQCQACEKYLLGELAAELRDAFEEHYFSCPECALQLQTASDFLGASRRLFATAPVPQPDPDYVRVPRGWFSWLKPVIAVPVFAVLLLLVAYQNLVTIPHWKRASAPHVLSMYSLISANTRGEAQGEGRLVFSARPNEPFGLYVDVPADPAYSSYQLRLAVPSGSSSLLRSVSSAEAQKTQVVTVNPGSEAGSYVLIVSGVSASAANPPSPKELARLQFTVELRN